MTITKKQLKKTNYFSHDSNARNDSKIISLRMKLGVEGYGIYFMIIERLREESDYVSNKDYDSFAFDFRTTPEKVKSVIEDFGLFIFTDDDCFYSESLMQRMIIKDEKSKKHSLGGKKAMEKRWNNIPETAQNDKGAITNLSNSDNIAITNLSNSDNKESKVKESKVKESKVNITHTKESENFSENFDEVEVEEIPTLEKEIPLQKSSAKNVSPIEDEFSKNLSNWQENYKNTKRFEENCITNGKTKKDLEQLLNEFIQEQEQSREHADKINIVFLEQSLERHFFHWVKKKKETKAKMTKKEEDRDFYKQFNAGVPLSKILG